MDEIDHVYYKLTKMPFDELQKLFKEKFFPLDSNYNIELESWLRSYGWTMEEVLRMPLNRE